MHLERAALDSPTVALANASRETLRMVDMIEAMLRGAVEVLRQDDRRRATEISRMDRAVDRLGGAIRGYLADLGNQQPLDNEGAGARVQEVLSAVINFEHIGDIIANGLMEFAVKKIRHGHAFATEELAVISAMHHELIESLWLGVAVFLDGDSREARRLVERKTRLRRMEADATALHIHLLRDAATGGRAADGDNLNLVAHRSGLFLRIVRDLRRIHSHIAALAYPVLNRLRDGSSDPSTLDHGSVDPAEDLAAPVPKSIVNKIAGAGQ
jgi:phosphate:Na+ symporter